MWFLERLKDAAEGRVAGIDYGTVRIGVALADLEIGIASPLETYTRGDETADQGYFGRLAEEEQLIGFVVGLPVHLSGEESQKSYEARQFADWLGQLTGLEVALFDERFTTSQAEQALLGAGLTKKRRKARRDQLAAQIMLAGYLESRTRGIEPPRGLDD